MPSLAYSTHVMSVVQTVIRVMTTVHPGGQVTITHPLLRPGETVEVLVLLPAEGDADYQSAVDILNALPGHQLFQTAEEVEQYLQEERASWDDDL